MKSTTKRPEPAMIRLKASTASAAEAARGVIDGLDELRSRITDTGDILRDLRSRPAGPMECARRIDGVIAELQREARSQRVFDLLAAPHSEFKVSDVLNGLSGSLSAQSLNTAIFLAGVNASDDGQTGFAPPAAWH